MTHRYAAGVEYDGGAFYGFQRQRQSPTVQSVLEDALGSIANEELTIHGAGRTDTGVHASGQVIHFDTHSDRPLRAWLLGANTRLPPSCSLIWIKAVDREFHSRFAAVGREYVYEICNRWPRPVMTRSYSAWVRQPLDAAAMEEGASHLLGEHDFTSFRARSCRASHAVRRLDAISVARAGDRIAIHISGNAFLHHMVRNIVGTLIEVGRGDHPPQWVGDVLRARDRSVAGPTAPAHGLCLTAVRYPRQLGIPEGPVSEIRD